jgi:hypothetical protein
MDPHKYGVSDQYITLDSFVKLRESRVNYGEYKWNVSVQGSTDEEVIGVRDVTDNVIEIQIGSFDIPNPQEVVYRTNGVTIPNVDTLLLIQNNTATSSPQLSSIQYPTIGPWTTGIPVPYTPWVNNPYSQLPFGKVTIQIKEAGLQSFSDRGGVRHHFELDVASAFHPNKLQLLTNQRKWDSYVLTDPLRDVHGFTLVFRNPDQPIRFLPDVYYDVSLEFTGLGILRINIPGHDLMMGDRIFINGCNSGNIVLDTYINRADGHVAAGDPAIPFLTPGAPIPDPWVFFDPTINITGLVTTYVLPQTVTVFIAKRRIRIPVRLRRIVKRQTNFIIP